MSAQARSRGCDEDVRLDRTRLPGVLSVDVCSRRSYERHTHDDFGIGVVLAGAQDSASGRGPVRAEAGDVITVNPGEVHDGVPIAGASRRWRMLYFRPEALAGALADLTGSDGSELAYPALAHAGAARAFMSLDAAARGPAASVLAMDGLLIETLSHLVGSPAGPTPSPGSAVAAARRRLDADPVPEARLEELAGLCGLSRFHFLRCFRAATGLPPHAYQVQRRLHLARRLILAGSTPAEAAADAGFADQAHLHRHFVRAYGYTPGMLARV